MPFLQPGMVFSRTTCSSLGLGLQRYRCCKGYEIKQIEDFQANQIVFFPNYTALVQPAFGDLTCCPSAVLGSVVVGMGKICTSEHVNSPHSHRSGLKPVPWP